VSHALKRPASLELDPVLHQQVRLAIASILAARGETTFAELKEALATTDGNLSAHLRQLEEAGYLSVNKLFENRRPLTCLSLTAPGRAAFARYLKHLEAVIKEAKR
jgi:DNA-binding MarR family transcriptional regulator